MGRVFDVSWLSNKTLVQAAVLASLALAGIIAIQQIQRVSAAQPGAGPKVMNISSTTDNSASSASSPPAGGAGGSGESAAASQTSLRVNGQNIPLPQNGSLSRTIDNQDGSTTTVNAQTQNTVTGGASSGQAGNTSSSSVNIRVNSSSSVNSGDGL